MHEELFIADQQINAGDHDVAFQEAFYDLHYVRGFNLNGSDWDEVACFHYGC